MSTATTTAPATQAGQPSAAPAAGGSRAADSHPYSGYATTRGELPVGFGPAAEPMPELAEFTSAFANWQKCRAWLRQLRRAFGPEPRGCRLMIAQRDFAGGAALYAVVLRFPRSGPASVREVAHDYAARLQDEAPRQWDRAAAEELGLEHQAPAPEALPSRAEPAGLTGRQLRILKQCYSAVGKTSDELLMSPQAAGVLADAFAKKARKRVPAASLVARVVAERKKGGWPTLTARGNGRDQPQTAGDRKVPAKAPKAKPAKRRT